jgi:hypothetical protein
MRLVTGFSATDFATYDGAAPGVADCRESAWRLAAAPSQPEEKARR